MASASNVLHLITGKLLKCAALSYLLLQVCSFVRAVLYDPEMRLNGGSVITCDPVPTAEAEHSLLTAVYTLYSSGSLPGALQDIYAEQVSGVCLAGSQQRCHSARHPLWVGHAVVIEHWHDALHWSNNSGHNAKHCT